MHHVHPLQPSFHKIIKRVTFLAQLCLKNANYKVLLLYYNHPIDVGEQLLVECIYHL